jgi:hypothetical protein
MAISDILKQSELEALFADNTTGDISPTDLRKFVSSVAPYGGVMRVAPDAAYPITGTPTSLDFDSYNIPGNDLMTFDLANNKCVIHAGGIYYVTWRLTGTWANTDDVDLHVFIDGVEDPYAYSLTKGIGANPLSISVSNYPIPITEAQVSGAGGNLDLELRISKDGGGSSTINIVHAQMEINYATLTKNLF